jgi:predicted MFS family arabinose efflux permease
LETGGTVRPTRSLSLAGFAATAVTYGPARMGFGLFLPQFRATFSISTELAGVVSSLGFLGFLIALLVASAMTSRAGPRLPVFAGCLVAAVGMGTVALAPDVAILSAGVVLALSSAGFAWAPFNDAANRLVEDQRRSDVLSVVSTGTTVGVATAGGLALLLVFGDLGWRAVWAAFAGAALIAAMVNWRALRGVAESARSSTSNAYRTLLQASAVPLYTISLSFGATAAVFISFAADRIESAGGPASLPTSASSAVVFLAYGLCGLAGLATARVAARLGLALLLRLLLLASAISCALVAVAPTSLLAVVVASGLQGVCVMMMSAALAFWSERLFPALPSLSFTAALVALALGSVLGPVLAGLASGAFGGAAMFLGAGAVSLATVVATRPGLIRDRAAHGAEVRPTPG